MILKWVNENKEWFFSGIGGMILGFVISIFLKISNKIIGFLLNIFFFVKKNIFKRYSITELKEFIDIYLEPNPVELELYSGQPSITIRFNIKNNNKCFINVNKVFVYVYMGQSYEEFYHHGVILKPNEGKFIYFKIDLSSEKKRLLEEYINNNKNRQNLIETNSIRIKPYLLYKSLPFECEKIYQSTVTIIGNYNH